MTKSLLIEIGVEELPAIPFLKELSNVKTKWSAILEKNALLCDFKLFYTPRRLVLWSENFPLKQKDSIQEFFGAPKDIAFKDDKPSDVALSFAKKCECDIKDLGFVMKNGKEVLYFKKDIQGQDAKKFLGAMIDEYLKSLNFGKSMRWGLVNDSFIRPIRWVNALLGEESVEFEVFDVKSKNISFAHRALGYESFSYENADEYFEKIKQNGVILCQDERREIILKQMNELEKEHGFDIFKDEELLDEVVAITENPNALVGKFDEVFLQIPDEVIITSMKEHQRYFPCFDKNGKLKNNFVVISNVLCDNKSLVVEGNERVLKARLSDALFFWQNDLKNGLTTENLKSVVFLDGLGSLQDKTDREEKIGEFLAKKYMQKLENETKMSQAEILELIKRSIKLSKADLLSEMVYEFTELQGLMGYYYAKAANEKKELCLALKEQYLPDSLDAKLPSSIFSSIIALSIKIDLLLALFSVDKIPSGTKDPFALRRAVVGIFKIVLKYDLKFNIEDDFKALLNEYKDFNFAKLEEFIIERMYAFFNVNPSIIKAVLQSGEREFLELSRKINALENIVKTSEFKEDFSTFKRVANITKDINVLGQIDKSLFENESENILFDKFLNIKNNSFDNYEDKLKALFGLKNEIEKFFESVLVNAEDEKLKTNRQNLLFAIYTEFKSIADIKEISF